MATAVRGARTAEIKTRTSDDVKKSAVDVFSRWGLSLSDAINMFLIKSIEVGGLPFDLRPERNGYENLAQKAYKPSFDSKGIAILPADWADDE